MIILFSIILCAVVGLVVYPAVRDIVLLQQQINDAEQFLESQYQRSRSIARRAGNIDEIVSSTATFTEFTVPQGMELDIIKTFEDIAERHNIEQKISVAYSDRVDTGTKLPYYTFTFLNHGMLTDHLQYLDAMQSQPYMVQIDSIDISRRNTTIGTSQIDNPPAQVTFRFSAIIYAK
jgi:hypothetical protein